MKRVEIEGTKDPIVVSKSDYEADRERGYCVIEFSPAGEMVLRNPRNPQSAIRRPVPQVLSFRCMYCQFDVIDGPYMDKAGGATRSGLDIMKEHLFRREHPWPYTAFQSPYGNVEDIVIEGVEEYEKEIEACRA